MSRPPEFAASRNYEIPAGTAYVGGYPFDVPRNVAIGRQVMMDGAIFRVRAVEWWSIAREPKRGEEVSLLLDPVGCAQE